MKKYAGFWRRTAAAIIDCAVFIFIPGFWEESNHLVSFLIFILDLAYYVWMNGTYGATIGKMVMGLKIVKENGSKLNYSDALLRSLATYLSVIVFGLGIISMIWDKKKQTWHDKIAKTIVVRS